MTKSLFAPADADFLTEEQARALAQRVLSFARADETRVNITSGWSGNTRFAGNEITTSGGTTNTQVTVTSTIGKRRASSQTNILDDESLRRTVDLAERLAKLSPVDPEAMSELRAGERLLRSHRRPHAGDARRGGEADHRHGRSGGHRGGKGLRRRIPPG